MVDFKSKQTARQTVLLKRREKPEENPSFAGRSHFRSPYFFQQLFLVFVIVLVNFNTLSLGYVLDDNLMITQNSLTKQGLRGIPEILTNDVSVGYFGKQVFESGGRYRPLSQTVFSIQYEFFGLNPFVGHLSNLVFYIITCLLVLQFLRNIIPGNPGNKPWLSIAFIASVLYALHPLHVEVVANIKSLDEILAMLFSLLGCLLIIRSLNRKSFVLRLLSFVCYFFALLSKENSITFMAVLPMILFFLRVDFRKSIKAMVPFFMAVVFYFIARQHALGDAPLVGGIDNYITNPFFNASLFQRLATVLLIWWKYILLLVFPYPLTNDYYPSMIPLTHFGNFRVILSLLLHVSLIIYAIHGFKKRKISSFAILFYFITFSIVSNLFLNIGTPMNDRFQFMPLLGFAILLTWLIMEKIPAIIPAGTRKFIVPSLICLLMLAYGIQTYSRNGDWKDDYSLFVHDVNVSDKSVRCNLMTGKVIYEKAKTLADTSDRKEMYGIAEAYLKKSIELYDRHYMSWGLLGIISMDRGDYQTAQSQFLRCLEIEPKQSVALANLNFIGRQYYDRKEYGEAELAWKRLLHYNPVDSSTLLILGDLYNRTGKYDTALVYLDKALSVDPSMSEAYKLKGEIYVSKFNDPEQAEAAFLKAIQLDPTNINILDNLGVIAYKRKNFDTALEYFFRATEIQPQNGHILLNIARTYEAKGDTEKMKEYFQKSQQAGGAY